MQAVFDLLNICYTGSGAQGCMLAMNKSLSKQLFRTHGIPTPEALFTFLLISDIILARRK